MLKVITEASLREELKGFKPEVYYIPEGKILSPAGREYLQQLKIKIERGNAQAAANNQTVFVGEIHQRAFAPNEAGFVDYDSGAFYAEKPEHMTHLHSNVLVAKDHPRIVFRGRLDSLQGAVVDAQCQIQESGGSRELVHSLQGILELLREIMRCDVLEEPLEEGLIIGLTHAQLRGRSHDPMKFYNIKQMLLPDCSMGRIYGLLNRIRTEVRETELAAVTAFRQAGASARQDIIQQLNRLSSAIHILMCMYLAGDFKVRGNYNE